jgi:hypothetical protein
MLFCGYVICWIWLGFASLNLNSIDAHAAEDSGRGSACTQEGLVDEEHLIYSKPHP